MTNVLLCMSNMCYCNFHPNSFFDFTVFRGLRCSRNQSGLCSVKRIVQLQIESYNQFDSFFCTAFCIYAKYCLFSQSVTIVRFCFETIWLTFFFFQPN